MTQLVRIPIRALLACCAFTAMASPPAQAAPLLIGETLFPAPPEPFPVGGTVVASATAPWAAPTFAATLTSTVVAGDLSNPFGGLTFTYQVHNDAASAHPLGRFTVNGFAGFLTSASYEPFGVGRAPTLINRPQDDYVGYSFIDFIGPGQIEPGMDSMLLVIQTNAMTYAPNFASVINGSVATTSTFAPVPEPATLALLAIGGAVLMIRRRRSGRR